MSKSTKRGNYHKKKKKRNKKYSGAAKQSERDLKKNNNSTPLSQNYDSVAQYLTGYNATIGAFTNQLGFYNSSSFDTSILSSFGGVQNQIGSFNSLTNLLPNIGKVNQASEVLELSRKATLAYAELSKTNNLNQVVISAAPNVSDWLNQSSFINKINPIQDIAAISTKLTDLIGVENFAEFNVQSMIGKSTELTMYAEKSLSSFSWGDLGSIMEVGNENKDLLASSYINLTSNYSNFLDSFLQVPSTFGELNPILSKNAPIEIYTGADLLESISIVDESTVTEDLLRNEIQYENEYTLSKYLPMIDSGLFNMWKGAIETFNTENSDKTRQFIVSIRELFTHVMHLLAPNDAIKKWTNEEVYYHNGNPTRRARLYYICRNASHEPFNKFFEKDIDATLAFINVFQEGTHAINSKITPRQLIALKSKAESTLKFLLEIEFGINNP